MKCIAVKNKILGYRNHQPQQKPFCPWTAFDTKLVFLSKISAHIEKNGCLCPYQLSCHYQHTMILVLHYIQAFQRHRVTFDFTTPPTSTDSYTVIAPCCMHNNNRWRQRNRGNVSSWCFLYINMDKKCSVGMNLKMLADKTHPVQHFAPATTATPHVCPCKDSLW